MQLPTNGELSVEFQRAYGLLLIEGEVAVDGNGGRTSSRQNSFNTYPFSFPLSSLPDSCSVFFSLP